MRETLFALDCGSTNWRIYRAIYEEMGRQSLRLIGEPQPSPLTSFIERRLPTTIRLNPAGTRLDNFGESVYQDLYEADLRDHIRDFFKPCIGSHLERKPLPHQTRYTHEEALHYTKLLLQAVLEQIRVEKWRSRPFDDGVRFAFVYPVHWRDNHSSQIFETFKNLVLDCFPDHLDEQISFMSEPEAALLSLRRQGMLTSAQGVALIIDVGGSTTDMTAGQLNSISGELEGVHRYGEPHGGGMYDEELARYIADQLKIPQRELDNDLTALHLLRMFGRQLKEALSVQLLNPTGYVRPPQRAITIVLHSGQVYRKTIRLDEFTLRDVCRHRISDFEHVIDAGLRRMRLNERDVSQVALVGGGAQLFTCVQHLRKRFGEESIIMARHPAETVVHGLALEYARSFGETKPWLSSTSKMPEPPTAIDARKTTTYVPEPSDRPRLKTQEVEFGTFDTTPEPATAHKDTFPIDDEVETVLETSLTGEAGQVQWQLVDEEGQAYPLESAEVTLGRKRTNTIVLYDDQSSRNHAAIRRKPDGSYEIMDLGSSNGTYLNGKRLTPKKPHPLKADDKLQIGRTKFVYRQ